MTDTTSSPSSEPFDLDVIRDDDALLDALGRGEPIGSDDGIGTLLAEWRSDLVGEPAPLSTIRSAHPADAGAAAVSAGLPRTAPRRRRLSRRVRLATVAAAIVAVAGGLVGAAATATPGGPLWSISQAIFPERADRIAAEDALAQARRAVDSGNFDQARRSLASADKLISRIHDPHQVAKLRNEMQQIEQLLASVAVPGVPLPTASAGTTPAPSSVTGPAQPPAPSAGQTNGPGPLLPSQLVPGHPGTKPAPLPTTLLPTIPPLPSLLPSLPLLGGGG